MPDTLKDDWERIARSRYRGCLLGGAVGDALGAPIEMMSWEKIQKTYGPQGISDLAPAYGRIGAITDDTQMTLFTGEGLLRAQARFLERGICNPFWVVQKSYLRWLATQESIPDDRHLETPLCCNTSWLFNLPQLHSCRLPGNTCLSSLRHSLNEGLREDSPPNDSKGCGGVMRIAPVGLFLQSPEDSKKSEGFVHYVMDFAGKIAKLTHGHVLSTLSSGAMAALVSLLVSGDDLPKALLVIQRVLDKSPNGSELWELLKKAQTLAGKNIPPPLAIREIGEGWVAEEALAIGVYASLRGRSLEDALRIAVNHGGDSDSTGSIAGNIVGARYGVEAIPTGWLEKLELKNEIQTMVDDLLDFQSWDIQDSENNGWSRYPPY